MQQVEGRFLLFPAYLVDVGCGHPAQRRERWKRAMSILMEIVQAIGDEAAGKLVSDFAGTRLYVPHVPEPEDPNRTLDRALGRTKTGAYLRRRPDGHSQPGFHARSDPGDARVRPHHRGHRASAALHLAPGLSGTC